MPYSMNDQYVHCPTHGAQHSAANGPLAAGIANIPAEFRGKALHVDHYFSLKGKSAMQKRWDRHKPGADSWVLVGP